MSIEITESGAAAVILTGDHPRYVDARFLTLGLRTSVQTFTAAQEPGVTLWAFDVINAQAYLDGRPFEGIALNPHGEFGLQTVSLAPGTWYFGAGDNALTSGQATRVFFDVSALTSTSGSAAGNVPLAVNGNPGAWRAMGFTVTGQPAAFLETEALGGRFAIMSESQFQAFAALHHDGYIGGVMPAIIPGLVGADLQGELTLPAGDYELVWINDTNGWAGGAANLSFFSTATASNQGAPNARGGVLLTDTPSTGADYLVATPAYAEIHAGAGADTIIGAAGQDYLRGDDGDDTVSGGPAFDDINGNMGNDTAHGNAGDDWVVGGKDNDMLYGDAGGDIVWGNLGNDTLSGGDGADQVRGGQGNDTLDGGAGADFVSGDRGDDTITGGAGADLFHGSQDAGLDRVLDFNLAEGDRVMLDPGTTYTVAQVGADTVLTMGPGHQMVLVGVQLSTLTSGWVFGA